MPVHPSDTLKLSASVVTVGSFDGVHRGHQALIRRVLDRAESLEVPSVVYTFDPPPRAYFQGVPVLTPLPEKLRRLEILGVDHVVVAGFDAAQASRSVEGFIEELKALRPEEVWVGLDFRFGRRRAGDVRTLGEVFTTRVFKSVKCREGEIISSSRVRALLARGAVVEARDLLGWGV
jgi:riboflavin kinase / FMN adenylyltransferase